MTKRRRTPSRPGLDDVRYKANRARLKIIGNHVCNWCHYPIDMQLAYPHPLSWSCDHKQPRSTLHPSDPRMWHIDGLAEAHLRCNQARGAKPLPIRPATSDTSIDW